jgi:lipopolysaccharide transport system ATP-binding protein
MSPMEPAVRAVELSKHYDIYRRPIDRALEIITGRPRHTVFPALQDVTFEVERGETIGIIGQNGAGKSTLLKLLCGVTRQSSGTLEARGNIASILELGTGFHPEFSGRDNAALNAAILGLTPSQVRERLPGHPRILRARHVPRPAGEDVLLGHVHAPRVLGGRQRRSRHPGHRRGAGRRRRALSEEVHRQDPRVPGEGKTILFCSHALYYVSSICRRTLWLDHGSVMRYGPSLDVVHDYETFLLQRDRDIANDGEPQPERPPTPVRFRDIIVCDRSGAPRDLFDRGEDIHIRARIHSDDARQPVHVIVGVHRSADDLQCFAVGTHADGVEPLSGRNEYELTVRLQDVPLLRGDYSIIAFAGDENAMTVFDRRDVRPAFSMTGERFEIGLINVATAGSSSPPKWRPPRDDVSLLVVNYRSAPLAIEAIRSARARPRAPLQVVVVDNSDEAPRLKRPHADVVIASPRIAVTPAASTTDARTATAMSSSSRIPTSSSRLAAIDALADALHAAVAGPALFWDDAHQWLLPPSDLHTALAEVRPRCSPAARARGARVRDRRRFLARVAFWSLRETTEVRALSGAVMAISRVRCAGGFDERFALYFEETDFLRRVPRTHRLRPRRARAGISTTRARAGLVRAKPRALYAQSELRYLEKWNGPFVEAH